mmetsp:Transcript_89646/g.237138  ORF Transcript_89646/g.237138 Transcript_89646/m.237138 type:complete len:238 (-) Transcript_89646:826-1539(-)
MTTSSHDAGAGSCWWTRPKSCCDRTAALLKPIEACLPSGTRREKGDFACTARTSMRAQTWGQRPMPMRPSRLAYKIPRSPPGGARDVAGFAHASSQIGPPFLLEYVLMALPKTRLRMAVSFMTMLSAGPDVSFRGSPTVSPVTEFLCASEPLAWILPVFLSCSRPAEMYFFELSQAPPVLLMEMASCTLDTRAPERSPAHAFLPKPMPATSGLRITRRPGAIISLRDASVEILMHFL